MNDIMSNSQEYLGESSNIIGSTQNSNLEDELTPFFCSPTMKKMLEVMVIRTFNHVLKPTLEKSIRNVVKHELELAEKKFLFAKGNSEKDIQAPKPRNLKLKFLTKVSVPVLTGVAIKGEGGNTIQVALIDGNTGEIVDSGPEASAKVEIVVLKGEFGGDNEGNWTAEEFCSNVVREREGKMSLLAETVNVRLYKGIGSIDKIRFTHSSIYMRTRMFRLGARIADTFNSIRVKEARTESFTVKDGRQLYNEKHDPPSLSDGVQRLKNIGRGSKYRLRDENVNTVEDFLILLLKDRERLKCVLNLKPKMLEETIRHAQRCIINEQIYSYIDFEENEGVVFNIVGEVQGLILGLQYLPMHLLSESDKDNAQRLLVSACEHWDHVVPVDNEMSVVQYLSQILPTKNPPNSSRQEVPSTSNNVENFRISDGHCSTSIIPARDCSTSIIPARDASAIGLNDCGSTSISNMEFSNSPIYSPSVQDWIDQCNYRFEDLVFGFDAHQPHDASASKVNVHNRWKMLLTIFRQSSMRRRAAALMDIQPTKKQKVC
ncbi:calmodulin-binding protein 60 A-like [Lycium barbarum]|uniref:calmodulin-binding protein 60 A-like n=1 Tax=Lycium barbarum TaxID=112863 RepID=UPI00293F3B2C|nr:calmodulin-binding protein 60 A-like [Lycium barbarum]